MKLDLSKPLLDLNESEIKDQEGKILTFASIFKSVLVNDKDDQIKTAEFKFNDFKLALKIEEKEVDLTIEDIVRIKKLVGEIPSTLIVGRVFQFIENK